MENILNILVILYILSVIVAVVLLLIVLVIEIREGKVRLIDTISEFFIALIMAFIPLLNIGLIIRAFKEI